MMQIQGKLKGMIKENSIEVLAGMVCTCEVKTEARNRVGKGGKCHPHFLEREARGESP